jgi:predicted phosphodiesterase
VAGANQAPEPENQINAKLRRRRTVDGGGEARAEVVHEFVRFCGNLGPAAGDPGGHRGLFLIPERQARMCFERASQAPRHERRLRISQHPANSEVSREAFDADCIDAGLELRELGGRGVERCEVGALDRGVLAERLVQQDLGSDVRDRARRAAPQSELRERNTGSILHPEECWGRVKRCVRRVVQRDTATEQRVDGAGRTNSQHRRQVRQHCAQDEGGTAIEPTRDDCMTEEVHGSAMSMPRGPQRRTRSAHPPRISRTIGSPQLNKRFQLLSPAPCRCHRVPAVWRHLVAEKSARPAKDTMEIAVISDLHLGRGGPVDGFGHDDGEFLRFLSFLERNFERVVLLGDIWETLTGAMPGYAAAELELARARHPEIAKRFERPRYAYVHGNHDLVAGAVDGAPDELVLEADGQRLLFTHGHQNDGLIVRKRWLSELGVWLGGWIRRLGLASLYRLIASFDEKRGGVSLDGTRCEFQRWAVDAAARSHSDIVITGHTHLATRAEHGPRLFLNSGTCSEGKLSFLSLDTRRAIYGVHSSY